MDTVAQNALRYSVGDNNNNYNEVSFIHMVLFITNRSI